MTEDNKSNEAQQIGGAVVAAGLLPVIGHSLSGAAAKTERTELPTGEIITPAENKTWLDWADKAPGLLREQFSGTAGNNTGTPMRMTGLAAGAALGVASFTNLIKSGGWKWFSRGASAGLAATGLYLGAKADALDHAAQETQKAALGFADALERNPALRQRLADYLSFQMSGEYVADQSLESAVAGKALEMARSTPFISAEKTSGKHCPHCL